MGTIIVILWIVTAILYVDLVIATFSMEFSVWRKKKRHLAGASEVEDSAKNLKRFLAESRFVEEVLWILIPIASSMVYALRMSLYSKVEYEYSSKTILEDVVSRGRGINAFILKLLWKLGKKS